MQTTLLGLAIAIILALTAALVGPHFVDWNRHRAEFEANASALIGLEVRVKGPIELRLLPTPALMLGQFEVSRPGDAGAVQARRLSVEFELGALARGEWRATNVRLEGVDFAIGLDRSGRIDWPVPALSKEAEALSIQRLDIVDGRALFRDATSDSYAVLEKFQFQGELRSLAGPLKGEGSFLLGGQQYPYRISAGRAGDDGAVRLRLNVDPIEQPLTADADGTIWIDNGMPRFEGTLALTRPVRAAPPGAAALIIEPWRLTGKFKGDSTAALMEQIEFQYGPEDRAIKLRGEAKLTLGQNPRLEGVLSSTQIDLDHLLALPEATRKRPLVAIKAFADYFAGAPRPPIPIRLGVSVETVTLAGAILQRVSTDLRSDADSWDVENLQLRAPGATQVGLSGRLAVSPAGITFIGPAKIEARDPRALAAWLTDRADPPVAANGALRAEGEVEFGGETLAINRLKAELDRMTIEGRLAYAWPRGERPARVEAALSTPDIDLDRAYALAQGIFADTTFEWPREGTLALKLGRAAIAGIEAKRADVNLQFNEKGLAIERLTIGDFGGAALSAQGRIDAHLTSPHGTVSLDLDARALDGMTTLIETIAPATAEQLRRSSARLVPAKLRAVLSINADAAAPGAPPLATFALDGSAGGFRVNLQGDAGSAGDAATLAHLATLASGPINLTGRLDAADGATLVEALALDRLVVVDKRPARMNFTASGALSGELAVDGQIVAGGLNAAVRGNLRIAAERATGGLDLLANGNLRLPRTLAGPRLGETVPAALTARLKLSEGAIALTDLSGKAGGSDVKGHLKIGFDPAMSVNGELELGAVNLPTVLGAAIGAPAPSSAAVWASEPFEAGVVGNLSGQVAIKSARVTLTPRLAAQDVRAVVQFGPSEFALQKFEGGFADGRLTGDLAFERSAEGLSARGQVKIAAADIAELFPGDGRPPMSGRLSVDVDLVGTGRSPIALIGSLNGSGSLQWQDGRVMRLNPAAFEAVARAIDQGLPIDPVRVHDRMELAFANGSLPISLAEGRLIVSNGQLRLGNPDVRPHGADLSPTGSIDLAENVIDARLVLSGPEVAGAPADTRPEVVIALKGSIDAPRRTLDVASFTSWLALRAVEQQAKRIDVLEAGGEIVPAPTAHIGPAPAIPPITTTPPALSAPRPIIRGAPEAAATTRQRPAAVPPSVPAPLDIRPTPR